jgi:hypothetical protein
VFAVVTSVSKSLKQMNCPLSSEALLTLGVHMRRKGNLGLPEPVFFVESAGWCVKLSSGCISVADITIDSSPGIAE